MRHRHLNTTAWTAAAIDSLLERGDLDDWRELFAAIGKDEELGRSVMRVAAQHDVPGASVLAMRLVTRIWPMLARTAA
ncbi:MAG: hypothetical protein ACK4WH_09430 [Phycisphaerales bacterium]